MPRSPKPITATFTVISIIAIIGVLGVGLWRATVEGVSITTYLLWLVGIGAIAALGYWHTKRKERRKLDKAIEEAHAADDAPAN